MEKTIHIVTDTSCDLPPQLIQEYEIETLPLIVHFGTDTYYDGRLSTDTFWEKAAQVHPRTSQPSVGMCKDVFERLVAPDKQVLCITITAKHSGTLNSARLAAQHIDQHIELFDSHSLSLGLGIQTLQAAQAARDGRSMQEILAMLESLRARMRVIIVLDTLEYLRQGGRADAFIAAASRMTRALNIKVIINLVEGRLKLLSAARSFNGGLKRALKLVEGMGPLEHLAVAHARRHETAEDVAQRLAERTAFPLERILVQETGAVLSAHAGPGVIGIVAVPAILQN